MRNSRTIMIPALLVAIASLLLLLYSFLGVTNKENPSHLGTPPSNFEHRIEKGNEGLFKTLGTVTVFVVAVNYAWLRLQKKRRSPSRFVRLIVKWFEKPHKYAGYTAIILVVAHGTYFLTQAAIKKDTYTGIAGFALLLTLGIYGFLIGRVPNKHMRKIHFMLANAFVIVTLIHAGGSAIIATFSVIVFWGLIWLIEHKSEHK
jgi:predicted MFS family arabinose efflux permease